MKLIGLFIAVLALLILPAQTLAQSTRAIHLKLSGPIDCRRLVDDLAAEFAAAKSAGAGLIIIEIEGRGGRDDLIHLLARHLHESPIPIAAHLNAAGAGSVGAQQAILGIAAHACFIAPRTSIAAGNDQDLRWLAPPDADFERIQRELRGLAWSALKSRGGDPELAHILIAPAGPAWIADTDGRATLITKPPEPPTSPDESAASSLDESLEQIAFFGVEGFERLHISAARAVELRIATATAGTPGQIASAAGVLPPQGIPKRFASGLAAARQAAADSLQSMQVAVARIDVELDLKKRLKRTITPADHRQAGARALDMIAEVDQARARLDQRLADYPELLQARPQPGSRSRPTSELAAKLQTLQRDLDKLRITAQEYATR